MFTIMLSLRSYLESDLFIELQKSHTKLVTEILRILLNTADLLLCFLYLKVVIKVTKKFHEFIYLNTIFLHRTYRIKYTIMWENI
jgi:hypothetical protein